MKSITNFIFEKLTLNNQSKINSEVQQKNDIPGIFNPKNINVGDTVELICKRGDKSLGFTKNGKYTCFKRDEMTYVITNNYRKEIPINSVSLIRTLFKKIEDY